MKPTVQPRTRALPPSADKSHKCRRGSVSSSPTESLHTSTNKRTKPRSKIVSSSPDLPDQPTTTYLQRCRISSPSATPSPTVVSDSPPSPTAKPFNNTLAELPHHGLKEELPSMVEIGLLKLAELRRHSTALEGILHVLQVVVSSLFSGLLSLY